MAFTLTLVYIALSHLSPAELFPAFGSYHVMQWLAACASLAALPHIVRRSEVFRTPQTGAMLGFMAAVGLSRLAHLWFGGVFPALLSVMPSAIVFVLVLATVNTLRKLQMVLAVVILVSLWLVGQALIGAPGNAEAANRYVHRAQMQSSNGKTVELERVQSVGLMEDPNDFAQFLLVATALLGVAWQSGRWVRNLFVVVAPGAILLYAAFLTQSRGAVLGFGILAFLVLRRSFNLKVSLPLTAVVVIALIAVSTRAISINESSAAGRVMAWGTGITMLKSSPLFGVGYGIFTNLNDLTAHNSFVLCFAELGLCGYFFWLALIVFSVRDLNAILRSSLEQTVDADLVRCAAMIRIALATFLVTAWFLSRTYLVTFYLLIAAAVAVRALAPPDSIPVPAGSRWALTGAVEVASIGLIYAMVISRAF